ncbi:hypothetical protein [Nocardia sp. XZ_19_369]|uniref:hypothetical protein n=1 Tax=Nocardia sp. XZ_19_369 TaxID=2769487 RepID=UPI0018909CBE|nr:hypothetical protein [Nocardia sp. XZ_19_369]
MGIYTFTLEQFHIDNTRSRHEDTNTVQFRLAVGNRSLGSHSFSAGDVNNGDHVVGLRFDRVVLAGSATPAVISYVIFNGDTGDIRGGMDGLSGQVADRAMDSLRQQVRQPGVHADVPELDYTAEGNASIADGDNWAGFVMRRIGLSLHDFVFPNCDGFVVIGSVAKDKFAWDRAVDAAGGTTCRVTIRYPGYDSPHGCGSNSDYTVTWSVTRRRANGPSLRAFFREHGLAPAPGLRSLTPGEPMSVRQLMT